MTHLRRVVPRCFAFACAVGVVAVARIGPACDCAIPDVEQGFAAADSVFSGEVVEIRRWGDHVVARVHVDAIWKGPVISSIDVRTPDNEAVCGFGFRVGERYIVYGDSSRRPEPECELIGLSTRTDLCTRTDLRRDEEADALGEPLWAASDGVASGGVFRRGDVDDDGVAGMSDMIRILDFLFRAGEPGRCRDAMDTNDDGAVDLSDSVFGLSYLFLGGAEPPAPGPLRPGYDTTTDDPFVCGDGEALPCDAISRSALPGVRLEIVDAPCVLTRAEAAAGVIFTYRLVVDESRDVTFRELGTCRRGHPGRPLLYERIHGGGQVYCLCDLGKCLPEDHRTDLARGEHYRVFRWCGRNWIGPSDFVNPVGDPFPPGLYTFEVRGVGTWHHTDRPDDPFELLVQYELELVE